jgi:hypothetical protein
MISKTDLIDFIRGKFAAAEGNYDNFDYYLSFADEALERVGRTYAQLGLAEERKQLIIRVMKVYVAVLESGDMDIVYLGRIESGFRAGEFSLEEIGIDQSKLDACHREHAREILEFFRKSPCWTWLGILREEEAKGVSLESIGTNDVELRSRMVAWLIGYIDKGRKGSRECFRALIGEVEGGIYSADELGTSLEELKRLEAKCAYAH